jgi:adenylate cyclase
VSIPLDRIVQCFHGVVPNVIATCSAGGLPNITYVSELHYVDANHVALSCQFFNKTAKNLRENPYARVEVYDPLTFEAYRLKLRFERSETDGPLFDTMSGRIDAIAAQTGMAGVFRLRSADICEVLDVQAVPGFLRPPTPEDLAAPIALSVPRNDPVGELRSLQIISDRINRASDLEELLATTLETLGALFGFDHTIILIPDDTGDRLVTLASRGYAHDGVGAVVPFGVGVIGAAARQKRPLRMEVGTELRYRRAIRRTLRDAVTSEVPICGLPDAESELAVPLLVGCQLVGVLAVESRRPAALTQWHEAFISIVGNQIATAIERLSNVETEEPAEQRTTARSFCLYKNDDCIFVDGEYLIRNVPAKILWKVLSAYRREGRTDFSNRELRLDPSLGLPPIKDNLESRLILLRRRLNDKCPDVRIVSSGRGKFTLVVSSAITLTERSSASDLVNS